MSFADDIRAGQEALRAKERAESLLRSQIVSSIGDVALAPTEDDLRVIRHAQALAGALRAKGFTEHRQIIRPNPLSTPAPSWRNRWQPRPKPSIATWVLSGLVGSHGIYETWNSYDNVATYRGFNLAEEDGGIYTVMARVKADPGDTKPPEEITLDMFGRPSSMERVDTHGIANNATVVAGLKKLAIESMVNPAIFE